MTTYIFDAILGPLQDGTILFGDQTISNYGLDDLNDAVGWGFCIPKTGVITDIGFLIYQVAGTPPEYNSGLVILTTASGWPIPSPYGGSAITPFTPVASGWHWITLNTPASGIMGEYASIYLYPGSTIPSATDHIKIGRTNVHYSYGIYGFPRFYQFATSWNNFDWGYLPFAVKYNDNDIYGFPIRTPLSIPISSDTSPDEIGVKFTLPFDVNCIGPCITYYTTNANVSLDIILYDSNDTVLRSVSFSDLDIIRNTNADGMKTDIKWSSAIALSKDVTYRLALKPTTSTTINACGIRFDTASDKDNNMFDHLSRWDRTQRVDGGSWTDIDTDIIGLGIIIDSISVETGAPAEGVSGGSYAYVG